MKKLIKILSIGLVLLFGLELTACGNNKKYTSDQILLSSLSFLIIDYNDDLYLQDDENNTITQSNVYYDVATNELISELQLIKQSWAFCESGKEFESSEGSSGTVYQEVIQKINDGYVFNYKFDYALANYGDIDETYTFTFKNEYFSANVIRKQHENEEQEFHIDILAVNGGIFLQYYKYVKGNLCLVKYFKNYENDYSIQYTTNTFVNESRTEYIEKTITDCLNFEMPEFEYVVCWN